MRRTLMTSALLYAYLEIDNLVTPDCSLVTRAVVTVGLGTVVTLLTPVAKQPTTAAAVADATRTLALDLYLTCSCWPVLRF